MNLKTFSRQFDVAVIGAGHAGAEAAHATARMGLRTALVTLSREKIAEMSCNPAIGGLAKGHIVCEIDALGGLMAQAIDATGIQFRLLNRSKGPAVWGLRAQADKLQYSQYVRQWLEDTANISIIEGEAAEVLVEGGAVCGVELADGQRIGVGAVVITTGTFLNGEIHIGERRCPAGRVGEPAAQRLSGCLERLGLRLGRLKTGTCPRLAKDSIDYDRCEEQPGDAEPMPFSTMTDRIDRRQTPCHITYTNEATHELLRANLGRAPLYTGQIQSTGPRYCPSIEVKIVRFANKGRHQLFLEPESLEYDWVYCNGLATSVPQDVQEAMVHSICGLERARIVQYGYAIEYDYIPPDQLGPTLETRAVRGLFLAGQINGTSGYEEAGGQGLLAGINAARAVQGKEPVILGRDQAYIGVMIDDLVTKGVDEPYRMFTSRAEFRLLLRWDTAERRLTPLGREVGIVDNERWYRYCRRSEQAEALRAALATLRVDGAPAEAWLRRPTASWNEFVGKSGLRDAAALDPRVVHQVLTDLRYEGYEERELRAARKLRELDKVRLPAELDYQAVRGLKTESREKFIRHRPMTLGQASRITGVTPSDIMVLMVYLNSQGRAANRSG
ncbi:MAG: tRNA uridine-5-carboxymethylaminomethyl(34) synthesis enzyme MnmG [Phycisphaerae bacterium]|nr:tRNA uridine-5-carboxymethylaminomethyl(34) synthesis enzyme MnmG [Phycisphaerae bacterium]